MQCKGKCHLAKQLQLTNLDDKEDDNLTRVTLINAFFPVYNLEIDYNFFKHYYTKKHRVLDTYSNDYCYLMLSGKGKPPPKCI